MIFSVLTFATALSIEALATLISVIGLATFFGANPIIIAMAVALDVGKVIVVSLMYKYWREMTRLMRTYATLATIITMLITSAGAAGYLTAEFQKSLVGTQEIELRVNALKEERDRLDTRKQQIDQQIANLPSNYSRSRIALMREFEAEQKRLADRLAELDRLIPEQKVEQITAEAKAGPIIAISKAFDIPVEEAAKYIIGLIIFVFDPLAVFLIVAGNFLWERRKKSEPPSVPPPPPPAPPPTIMPAGPDASMAQTYTRDDLIELGATDEALKLAGYEPRDPIFEELKPSEPPPVIKTKLEANEEMGVSAAEKHDLLNPQAREVITKSSLGMVKPDPGTRIAAHPGNEVGYGTGVFKTGKT